MRRTKASARHRALSVRTATEATMNGRNRTNSTAMKVLLGRQLASITDTLAKASQRRDEEIRRRIASKSPAVLAPSVLLPTNPSLTSDTEGSASSDSSDGVMFAGHQKSPNLEEISQFDRGQPQANRTMGRIHSMPAEVFEQLITTVIDYSTPRFSPCDDDTADDDDNPKSMFAQFENDTPPASVHADNYPKEMLALLNGTISAVGAEVELEPKKMLAELAQIDLPARVRSEGNGNNFAAMPSGLGRASVSGESIVYEEANCFDPKQLLAEFEVSTSAEDQTTIYGDWNGPRAILAELEGRTSSADDDHYMRMLADLEQKTPLISEERLTGDNDDGMTAHRLMNLLPPTQNRNLSTESVATCSAKHDSSDAVFDMAIAPHGIALLLEIANLPWEEAQAWTRYLFSNGLDGHKARQIQDKIVEQTTQELDKVIEAVLSEEKQYLAIENVVRLPCRLLVSNIAADAGEEDLKGFFHQFMSFVQEVKLLPKRDPIKRTRIAHIDMSTREAAIRASYVSGSIFGLVLNIKLAVEKEE